MKKETKKAAPKSAAKKKIPAKPPLTKGKKISTPLKTAEKNVKSPSRVKKTVEKKAYAPPQQPQTQLSHRRPLLIIPK